MNLIQAAKIVELYMALTDSQVSATFADYLERRKIDLLAKNCSSGLMGKNPERDFNAGAYSELNDLLNNLNNEYEEAQELLKADKPKGPVETKEK